MAVGDRIDACEACDAELCGFIVPLERDGRDPGGVGEEVGGAAAPAATWAQLCVNLLISTLFHHLHQGLALRLKCSNSRLILLHSLKERLVLLPKYGNFGFILLYYLH